MEGAKDQTVSPALLAEETARGMGPAIGSVATAA